MGRYTLNVELGDLGKYIVKIPEKQSIKEKVSLMAIDSYTIGKKPSFILKELGFTEATIKGQTKFYISYIVDSKEKKLDVIFDNPNDLKQVANEGNRKISLTNEVFVKFIDKVFLPMITKQKFISFLKNNNLLTFKLNEWIQNYLSDSYNKDFCYQKILQYASDYKQYRALVTGVEIYINSKNLDKQKEQQKGEERPNYDRFVLSKLQEEIDPDKEFGLYSEEELRKYAEYLDSLPSSELDEIDKRR